jgi:radical SAM protein with 4Fe4S-binding SPASM domain
MYLGKTNARKPTHARPKVQKATAPLPQSHHILEDILANANVRKLLLWMTQRDSKGECFFEKLCRNYDNPDRDFWNRLRWAVPNWVIDYGLKKARLDKGTMKEKLFHHLPTVKALTLTAKSIGTYGLTVPQRYTAPLFVVWNITQACNLTCKHCYQDATRKPRADELTTEEKLNLLDQMADEFVPFLALAGGEPLVTPDLWAVLEHCRKRGIHVTLATNGTLLTREMCQRLRDANVKYIEVSVDSLDPAQHDAFRGQAGAWKRTIQGIRNSVEAGIRTGMACCFTRQNAHMVDEAVKFAIDLGCKTFAHFNFIPVGRGREIMDQDLTPGQRELLLRKLQRHLEEGKIGVVSTAPQFGRACIVYGDQEGVFATGHAGRGPGKKTMVLSRYIGGCGSGRCYCSVQPNGIITPCVYMPFEKVGDIRKQTLAEIWDNPLFHTLQDREDRGDHCGVCDYRHYCGGCRARALSYTGDIQAGDPGCTFNYQEWQELAASGVTMAANLEAEAWKASGAAKPDLPQQAEQLVQILASGPAGLAAKAGNNGGIKIEEIRDAKNTAGQFRSGLPIQTD